MESRYFIWYTLEAVDYFKVLEFRNELVFGGKCNYSLLFGRVGEEGVLNQRFNSSTRIENFQIGHVRHFKMGGELLSMAVKHFLVFIRVRDFAQIFINAENAGTLLILSSSSCSTSHLEILARGNCCHGFAIELG
jgi:hypothetical protein